MDSNALIPGLWWTCCGCHDLDMFIEGVNEPMCKSQNSRAVSLYGYRHVCVISQPTYTSGLKTQLIKPKGSKTSCGVSIWTMYVCPFFVYCCLFHWHTYCFLVEKLFSWKIIFNSEFFFWLYLFIAIRFKFITLCKLHKSFTTNSHLIAFLTP